MSSYFFGRLNNGIVDPRGSTVGTTNIKGYYIGFRLAQV